MIFHSLSLAHLIAFPSIFVLGAVRRYRQPIGIFAFGIGKTAQSMC